MRRVPSWLIRGATLLGFELADVTCFERKEKLMPHPNDDVLPDGTCRGCHVPLSRPIRRRGVTKIYRRHLSRSPDCPFNGKGRGEQIEPQPPRLQ
jgi:hypothetical protein